MIEARWDTSLQCQGEDKRQRAQIETQESLLKHLEEVVEFFYCGCGWIFKQVDPRGSILGDTQNQLEKVLGNLL